MRRLRAEAVVIGSGAAAMLAASRLLAQGVDLALVNPAMEFNVGDLRPRNGLSLWNAAYRALDGGARAAPVDRRPTALPELYDELVERLREAFPASVDHAGLSRGECLSVLSSAPVHREKTEALEREFFRIEKTRFNSGHYRLVNAETALASVASRGARLAEVAQVDGAVLRAYAIHWDAVEMGMRLASFVSRKLGDRCIVGADVESRIGRQIMLSGPDGEKISIEARKIVLVLLTGHALPHLRSLVAARDEPWLRGVRKRRRERHFAWFEAERRPGSPPVQPRLPDSLWMELGAADYLCGSRGCHVSWQAVKGPDNFDRAADEALRLGCDPERSARFVRAEREFFLAWDWKAPSWKGGRHGVWWGTAFEGDLSAMMDLLWNMPA